MPEFTSWKDRLQSCSGVLPDRVRATRSATEENADAKRQRQCAEMTDLWGEVDPRWCWHEIAPGHKPSRPVLADLLAFCESNPRRVEAPGSVEWSSPDRLGRFLDDAGRPDIFQFLGILTRFEVSGWIPRFASVGKAGVAISLVDLAIDSYGSVQVPLPRHEEIR